VTLLGATAAMGLAAAQGPQRVARFEFGPPANLGPVVNSPAFDGGPSISADGLSLYFTSERPGGSGGGDLWVTRRTKLTDPFGAPENLRTAVNSPANEFAPSISADGLSIYFDSDRPGGLGSSDIWVATRAATAEPFGPPRNVGAPVNSAASDGLPGISADGLTLYFSSRRAGGLGEMDLWAARRKKTSDPFTAAESLGAVVNSPHHDWGPSVSADGRYLFFMSDRPGGHGSQDIWAAERASDSSPFGRPQNLGPSLNSPALDARPSISADGSTLFFMSDRPHGAGQIDLWQASARPRARRRQ